MYPPIRPLLVLLKVFSHPTHFFDHSFICLSTAGPSVLAVQPPAHLSYLSTPFPPVLSVRPSVLSVHPPTRLSYLPFRLCLSDCPPVLSVHPNAQLSYLSARLFYLPVLPLACLICPPVLSVHLSYLSTIPPVCLICLPNCLICPPSRPLVLSSTLSPVLSVRV